jgi:putative tricarboxylic transport membrane protein
VHNLQPGPLLFTQTPDLFYTLLIGGFIGCIMILILGFTIAPQLAKIVLIPKKILLPLVAILCVIGAYAINGRVYDVLLMILFGFAGFIMKKRGYSVAPMVLGLVLGKMMDENFRRAVSLAQYEDNPVMAMFSSPISIVLVCLVVLSLLSNLPAFKKLFRGKRK